MKRSPYSDWPLPLYLYLIRAYFKFFTVGQCLGFPLVLQIQTQSLCNSRCSICPYRLVSKALDHGAMQEDLFQRIANELMSEMQFSTVVFALHNEPLLDRRLFAWVKQIKATSPNRYCIVSTNGELLDRFSSAEIVESNLDRLTISLNAHSRETYERINVGLDYERVMNNVCHLVSDGTMRQKVELRFALTKQNVHEVKRAVDYWKDQGVRTKVRGITNRAGSLDNYESLRVKEACYNGALPWRAWKRLMSIARGAIGCDLPFYQMNVLFNGDAIICCHDWNRGTVVGSARTSSLRAIWNSEKMNDIRRLILQKRYDQIGSCRGCSLTK